MEFEWSETKRAIVLETRELDFLQGKLLFDGRVVLKRESPYEYEKRWLYIGELNGKITVVVWTKRGISIRIITMRRARDEEERGYRQLHGRGN